VAGGRTSGRRIVGITVTLLAGGALSTGCRDTNPVTPSQVDITVTAPAAGPVDRPGPGNTGVPVGTRLTLTGDLTLKTPDEVVDGLLVRGCVTVSAPRVTIKNSQIQCRRPDTDRAVVGVPGADGYKGLVIEDTELDGGGIVDIGVDVTGVTLRRVNIHHFNDGVRIGSNILIEDSWVHDMTRIGELHADAIQGISAKNVVIRGNTLDPTNAQTGDLGNSAIQLGSETGTRMSSNVVIEDNVMDGGNYALNISGAITAEDFTVRGNSFGRTSRYGPIVTPTRVPIGEDNIMLDTGEEAVVDYPR
jgi:hypothetical protein